MPHGGWATLCHALFWTLAHIYLILIQELCVCVAGSGVGGGWGIIPPPPPRGIIPIYLWVN